MALSVDFAEDFYFLDALTPLTLRIAGQSDQAIPQAMNHAPNWKDPDNAGGQVLEGDRYWVWPIPSTPTQPPLGSILIDQWGEVWAILSIKRKPVPIGTWAAQTRNLSVVNGLNNVATVLEASYTKSAAGEALPVWNTVLTNVPARFQPLTQDAQILEDAE